MINHEAPAATIDDARKALQKQHVTTFLDSLSNPDDAQSERNALNGTLGALLKKLIALEQKQMLEFFSDDIDEICPSCLAKASMRFSQTKNLALLFNELQDINNSNADH